jgi:hypothetical protein
MKKYLWESVVSAFEKNESELKLREQIQVRGMAVLTDFL